MQTKLILHHTTNSKCKGLHLRQKRCFHGQTTTTNFLLLALEMEVGVKIQCGLSKFQKRSLRTLLLLLHLFLSEQFLSLGHLKMMTIISMVHLILQNSWSTSFWIYQYSFVLISNQDKWSFLLWGLPTWDAVCKRTTEVARITIEVTKMIIEVARITTMEVTSLSKHFSNVYTMCWV